MALKEAVFKMSSHPVLSPMGRFMYFLCERVLSRTFQSFPEIRSAYVSGSMSAGDIVPGLSDIDCVITIDDLGAREEYGLVTELERKIRYRMPPFGRDKIGVHVIAYSAAEWSLLGNLFLGKRAGQPRRLFARNESPPDYELSGRIKALHHLYKAFWKIINLQDNILKPSGDPLEPELTKRIIDRAMITLDDAVKEAGDISGEYTNLSEKARQSWEILKRTGNESKHIEMLAMLLHLFDVAAGAFYKSMAPGDTHSTGDVEPVGEIKILPAEITDIVPVIQQHQNDKDVVVYTNVEKADIFLFDSANRGLSAAIVEHYKGIGDRALRIMSIDRFRQFLLNFSEQAAVDIFSGRQFILAGIRDREALLLDAYSILPQLRSPRNWKSGERYESFRGKAERIIREFGASVPDARVSYGGATVDEYERYSDLKEMSQALTAALGEFLSRGTKAHD